MSDKSALRIGTKRSNQISMLKGREVGKLTSCSAGNRGKSKERREPWRDRRGRENARRLRDWLVSMASRNVSRSNARTFDPVRLSFETASCAEEAKRITDPRYFFFFSLIASNWRSCRCIAMCPRLYKPQTDTEITSSTRERYFLVVRKIDC